MRKMIAAVVLALMVGPLAPAATASPVCDAVREGRNAIGFYPPGQGDYGNGICAGGIDP